MFVDSVQMETNQNDHNSCAVKFFFNFFLSLFIIFISQPSLK